MSSSHNRGLEHLRHRCLHVIRGAVSERPLAELLALALPASRVVSIAFRSVSFACVYRFTSCGVISDSRCAAKNGRARVRLAEDGMAWGRVQCRLRRVPAISIEPARRLPPARFS
jgi:hypothetical protein